MFVCVKLNYKLDNFFRKVIYKNKQTFSGSELVLLFFLRNFLLSIHQNEIDRQKRFLRVTEKVNQRKQVDCETDKRTREIKILKRSSKKIERDGENEK